MQMCHWLQVGIQNQTGGKYPTRKEESLPGLQRIPSATRHWLPWNLCSLNTTRNWTFASLAHGTRSQGKLWDGFHDHFLNNMLNKEIYLKQPKGFMDLDHPDWVWQVKASLYGLKQAPCKWNQTFTNELLSHGMEQSKHHPVLFTYKQEGKVLSAIVVHVDNFIVTVIALSVDGIGGKLHKRFRMSKRGPLDAYLSLKFDRRIMGWYTWAN